jgi:iron complex outermembrane receptor protein
MSQGNSTQSVQVDGLPGTASRYGSPTTANIERVEVLKGPVSVMYGQANPGGLLNISTKRPKAVASNTLTASVASYAGRTSGLGSDMSYTGLLDLTGPLGTEKKWLYRLILTQERTESFRNDVEGDTWHIYPMLTYRWDADTELTAQFEYGDETRTHDDGMMAPNNDPTKMASMEIVYNEPGDIDWDEGSRRVAGFPQDLPERLAAAGRLPHGLLQRRPTRAGKRRGHRREPHPELRRAPSLSRTGQCPALQFW